jgi:hypothetical protein
MWIIFCDTFLKAVQKLPSVKDILNKCYPRLTTYDAFEI